jgi:hypothetical protein
MSISPAAVELQKETESEKQVSMQLELQNSSEIGALILTSVIIYCPRPSATGLNNDLNALYSDPACRRGQVVVDASRIDGNTSFAYNTAFSVPKDATYLQLFVTVWFARADRLRIAPNAIAVSAGGERV